MKLGAIAGLVVVLSACGDEEAAFDSCEGAQACVPECRSDCPPIPTGGTVSCVEFWGQRRCDQRLAERRACFDECDRTCQALVRALCE